MLLVLFVSRFCIIVSELVNESRSYVIFVSVLLVEEDEDNVSFNDALSTFYLRLYGIGHNLLP